MVPLRLHASQRGFAICLGAQPDAAVEPDPAAKTRCRAAATCGQASRERAATALPTALHSAHLSCSCADTRLSGTLISTKPDAWSIDATTPIVPPRLDPPDDKAEELRMTTLPRRTRTCECAGAHGPQQPIMQSSMSARGRLALWPAHVAGHSQLHMCSSHTYLPATASNPSLSLSLPLSLSLSLSLSPCIYIYMYIWTTWLGEISLSKPHRLPVSQRQIRLSRRVLSLPVSRILSL
eukprot:361354-Chlamydomonas_euryale.AAC.2